MAPLSLKRQFTRYTTLPFILVGLLLVAVIVGSDYAARQAQIKEMLDQRALAIKMNFSAYLDRAEFEAMYLTQHIDAGGSLDSLFQLHDVFYLVYDDVFQTQHFYALLPQKVSRSDDAVSFYGKCLHVASSSLKLSAPTG